MVICRPLAFWGPCSSSFALPRFTTSPKTISLSAPTHPVEAATIFQSSTAQLTRKFTVDLTRGRNVLIIYGLSSKIDRESIRINGLGKDARVIDISCIDKERPGNSGPTVEQLTVQRNLLNAEREVRDHECRLLDGMALPLFSEDKLSSFDSFMNTFVTRKRNALQAVIELDTQIKELDKKIRLLKDSHQGETVPVVTVTLLATEDVRHVEFQLTYLITSGVTWQPCYDLHASSSNGKPTTSEVSLHYYANITQNTGEHWDNATLILCTADPREPNSFTIGPHVDSPSLFSTRQGHSQNARPQQSSFRNIHFSNDIFPSAVPAAYYPPSMDAFSTSAFNTLAQRPTQAPPQDSSEDNDEESSGVEQEDDSDSVTSHAEQPEGSGSDRDTHPFTQRVEDRVSLTGDGRVHKVSVAVLNFQAALQHTCAPHKRMEAFIEGRIKNTSKYKLPAGPMNVFMDDTFFAKMQLGFVGVDESFTCMFGTDTSLEVSRTTSNVMRTWLSPSGRSQLQWIHS